MNRHDALRQSVDSLLADLSDRRALLISAIETWPPSDIEPLQAGYLAALLDLHDSRVCANRALHGKYFRYIGHGKFVCDCCAMLSGVKSA